MTTPLPGAEYVVTTRQADSMFAKMLAQSTSATRVALDAILPKGGGGTTSTSLAQTVAQRSDGTWPNPVRDGNVAARFFRAVFDGSKQPRGTDGVLPGDVLLTRQGWFIATAAPSTGPATWDLVAGGTGGSTDPGTTTPGTTTPGTPGDPSPSSPTARPRALLGTSGEWLTTGGTSLVTALSDQAASSASATPTAGSQGVSVSLDMQNFTHALGNDLTVTLWGVSSSQPGDVTVTVGKGSTLYVPAKTLQVGTAAGTLAFTWPKSDQLSLTADTWRDIEVTVSRTQGGFTNLADVTLQSAPPVIAPPPGVDTLTPTSIIWSPQSVWYSDLTSAPLANASAAVSAYVKGLAGTAIRLDCYADAAPMWMASASDPRVNVTPPATSTRGAITLMHTADGKGALDGVPIPADMTAPTNLFKTAIVGSVDTKQVWELLGLTKSGTTWSAEWGGRIDAFNQSGGVFPTGTGYTGSGLSFTAAAIKVSEAKAAAAGDVKAIPHALGLNLTYGGAASAFCWPATRSDGTAFDTGAPKMGQRLRLKATADLSACTPLGKAVGEALKRYGAVVMGGAERVGVVCESESAIQVRSGVNPWGAILNGKTIDTVLSGLPLDQLEAVSPGWGGPTWKVEDAAPAVPTPTTPNPGTGAYGYRTHIYAPPAGWLSGASCRAIENSSDGMGSPFAQWRGEPCTMARTWWDRDSKAADTLGLRWNNWHASIDGAPGLMFNGEDWSKAAAGDSTMFKRLEADLRFCRQWYLSRRDPKKVNFFLSPAHEANGDWYRWSWRPDNRARWIEFMKRYRELQLRVFPEALMTLNVNYDTKASVGMDWRRYIPDYDSKGAAGVKQWFDVGSVDYYNAWSVWANTQQGWNDIANSKVDQWGAPIGLDKHRQFWESCGLPMTVPEWGGHATRHGDAPEATTAINNYFRKWAGAGPGRVIAEAYFNLTSGYDSGDSPGKFAIYGDTVALVQTSARYKALTWGV